MIDQILSDWLESFPRLEEQAERPLVTLSFAQTMDGALSAERGLPTALSGSESLKATHFLRSRHDGVLVGVETVISDDPRLTMRLLNGTDPRPVILDSGLRTSPSSRIFGTDRSPLILCTNPASEDSERRLRDAGAQVVRLASGADGRGDIKVVLRAVRTAGILTLMVEGGVRVLISFFDSGLWDRAAVTLVPRWIGGYRLQVSRSVHLDDVRWATAGEDALCLGRRAG